MLVLMLVSLLTPITGAFGAETTVTITTTLQPKNLTITPGTTVIWTNQDAEEHRMRSETGPEEFDSGNLETGESYSFNFAIEGTYTYIDDRNDEDTNYHGTITVSAAPDPGDPGDPGDPAPPPPPPPTAGDVSIVDRSFQPASLTVAAGATVTWANNDGDEHTVTATDSSWDSGIFDTGGTFSRTFETPGTFNYLCLIHPDMTGAITVSGGGGDLPAPPPPPDPDPPPPNPDPPPPSPGDVNIVDFAFTPASLTVTEGATVTWSNTGAAPHTVTATGGSFDSGVLFAGDTYTRTFATAGTYNYLCTLHPEMTATVVVTGSDGTAPPPAPDPEPPPGGDPAEPGQPATAPPPGGIAVVDNAFSPSSRTITTGTRLVWSNTGALPHTVTSSAGGFDSGILLPGSSYAHTFTQPGTFPYVCTIHPGMTGTITVTGAPTGEAPGETTTAAAGGLVGGPPAWPFDDPPPWIPGPGGAGAAGVEIFDNGYTPESLTVQTGQTVTWANTGELPHTVTARDGSFDSGFLVGGDTFSHVFTEVGTFEIFCTIHPEMVATITVDPGDAAATPVTGDAATDPATGEPPAVDAPSPVTATEDVAVAMVDNAFRPRTLRIEAGQTVTWTNEGDLPHTVTAADESYDSGLVLPGQTFQRTFAEVGRYEYVCTVHPEMTASVEVLAAGPEVLAAATPAAPVAPLSNTVAYVLAASIVAAVGVFAIGMARFGQAAARER